VIAALLSVGLVLVAPVDAAVGIDPGTVEVGQPIAPDTDTVVGELTVRNPGSQRSAYAMYAQQAPEGLPISVEWFTFEPSGFELDPGATQVVTVRIMPDAGASPGRYTALLTAALATSPDSPVAAQVSGAVATEASFVIENTVTADPLASTTGSTDDGTGGIPTWAWGIAALTLVIAVLSVSSALRDGQQSDHTDRSATS
jgi:uncharacterized membrane protein